MFKYIRNTYNCIGKSWILTTIVSAIVGGIGWAVWVSIPWASFGKFILAILIIKVEIWIVLFCMFGLFIFYIIFRRVFINIEDKLTIDIIDEFEKICIMVISEMSPIPTFVDDIIGKNTVSYKDSNVTKSKIESSLIGLCSKGLVNSIREENFRVDRYILTDRGKLFHTKFFD